MKTATIMQMYRPHLTTLEKSLTAAVFPLMKIYPAEFCIRQALDEGQITKQSQVIESSSGTMALGLALVCNLLHLKLTIVTDHACDEVLRGRLEDLGTRVACVTKPASLGGFQRARLDLLHQIEKTTPDTWWVNQYDNPCNPGAYGSFAAQLVEELGRVDCLVGTVGSGGSICGTSRFLRTLFPNLHVIGVDTFNSVLFGQPDGSRTLRGLGNSILPKNLDHTEIDEVHWVSAAEAYTATRILHRTTGMFRGGTSGAAWLVARYWAELNPERRVVCILPDDGNRYVKDLYHDPYMHQNGLWLSELPSAPRLVDRPDESGSTWSMFRWNRRPYQDVITSLTSISA